MNLKRLDPVHREMRRFFFSRHKTYNAVTELVQGQIHASSQTRTSYSYENTEGSVRGFTLQLWLNLTTSVYLPQGNPRESTRKKHWKNSELPFPRAGSLIALLSVNAARSSHCQLTSMREENKKLTIPPPGQNTHRDSTEFQNKSPVYTKSFQLLHRFYYNSNTVKSYSSCKK